MTQIVEVNEHGAIQLPAELARTLKPHARFTVEQRGQALVLQPVHATPFWVTATPKERADALRRWAALERPAAPPLSAASLSREHMYD